MANPNAWSSTLTLVTAANITLSTNLLEGPRSVSDTPGITETGTLISDPLFVNSSADPTAANFQLQHGSPAIGAADSTPAPATDLLGVSRPQGSANDLGAFAYASTSSK